MSEMPIFLFDRSAEQTENLKSLAEVWHLSNGFWSIGLTLDAARRPGSLILFCADCKVDAWQAAALCDVGPYDAELLYVYTRPEARGQGLARALLESLKKTLADREPLESMFLEVRPSNRAAIQMYEKLGMEHISIRAKYYSDGEDALVYRWALSREIQ